MSAAQFENVSADLIWECVNGRGAQLVKTKMSGGQSFSRDPFNLLNKHNRKQEGFVNNKAISIQPSEKGVTLITKSGSSNKPAKAIHTTSYAGNAPSRKIYRSIVANTGKRGYRSDLRAESVARASAILMSRKAKKDRAPAKARGKKAARKAEEA